MSNRELPARPNLNHYKKQAKDLVRDFGSGSADARIRVRHHHPHFYSLSRTEFESKPLSLTEAQLVIAREHGFPSWPKFAQHIELQQIIESVASIDDPEAAFLEVACVPRHTDHGSGSLHHAEMILARYPQVARSNIYTTAILGDDVGVGQVLARNDRMATVRGGPRQWDALTYLCFSRYLRLDPARSDGFVRCARMLLEAGADANTGWAETIDHPNPRVIHESVIYGAAGIARNAELTRVLLEYGADPNDEETPYHVPEGYDNTVMQILLESGRLNSQSLVCMLVRKADWHDTDGMQLVLESKADPNLVSKWAHNGLQQAVRRDNRLEAIALLLDHGADPGVVNAHGSSATAMAARRGRGDVLRLFEQRGFPAELSGADRLIERCARGDGPSADEKPEIREQVLRYGGTLLAEFSGNGNVAGVRCLLDLGVRVDELYTQGDGYFDIARNSTALHVAAWRAWPEVVQELIQRGAPVNQKDGKGRTALFLAVKACVDSYWTARRSPDSVRALLEAGAALDGIEVPCGYDKVDHLLRAYGVAAADGAG